MHPDRNRRGSTVVMFTLSLVFMIGVLGLVVDVGWAYFRRQAAQAAADAAALAAAAASTSSPDAFVCGSNGIACQSPTSCGSSIPSPPANNLQVGCLYAQSNGFSAANGQNVLISANTTSPAPGVSGVQVPYWITVSVSEKNPQTFSSIFGQRFLTIGALATAAVFPAPGDCVYSLSNSGVGVSLNGNNIVSTKCGVYVDSSDSGALTVVGNNAQITVSGADIEIVGNYSAHSSTQVSPAPKTGMATAPDPLQFMPAPAIGACTSSGVSLNGGTLTINPGVYCGSVSVGGNGSLTLNPGTYVLEGGISVGGGASLTGGGVTLYNQSGSISISGGGIVQLSPPIAGTYMGVTIFQNRANTNTVSIVGGAAQFVTGVVYAPAAGLNYTGGSATQSLSTMLISNTLTFVGNSYLTASPKTAFSGGAGGPTLIQ